MGVTQLFHTLSPNFTTLAYNTNRTNTPLKSATAPSHNDLLANMRFSTVATAPSALGTAFGLPFSQNSQQVLSIGHVEPGEVEVTSYQYGGFDVVGTYRTFKDPDGIDRNGISFGPNVFRPGYGSEDDRANSLDGRVVVKPSFGQPTLIVQPFLQVSSGSGRNVIVAQVYAELDKDFVPLTEEEMGNRTLREEAMKETVRGRATLSGAAPCPKTEAFPSPVGERCQEFLSTDFTTTGGLREALSRIHHGWTDIATFDADICFDTDPDQKHSVSAEVGRFQYMMSFASPDWTNGDEDVEDPVLILVEPRGRNNVISGTANFLHTGWASLFPPLKKEADASNPDNQT